MIIGIIAIIIVIIRNKSNSNKSTSNNNIVVLIEIRIEIFQGVSLRMGSLHHIRLYSYTEHTGHTRCPRHGDSIASLTCQMPIKSLHTIPTVAQKAVDGAEGVHQSNYPHQVTRT